MDRDGRKHALSQVCLRQSNNIWVRWVGWSWMRVECRLERVQERENVGWNQWKVEESGREESFKNCSSLWLALLAPKWQTNGTAIWQEFSLLLPTFNRPWHEHPAPCTRFSSGNFFIINLLYGSEWRHGAATCHNSGELPTRPAGRESDSPSEQKIQNCRHGAVRRVAGVARAGSRPQLRAGSTGNLVANHCHCHFANIFTPNAATICLHERSAQWAKGAETARNKSRLLDRWESVSMFVSLTTVQQLKLELKLAASV